MEADGGRGAALRLALWDGDERRWAVGRADLDRLRSVGFSDRAILDLNLVTGYYAFVNRLAGGLGVPLESSKSEEKPGEKHD